MIDQAARSIEKDAVVFPHLPDVARAPELPLDVFAARLARATVKSLTPRQQLFLEGDHKANIYQVLVGAFVLYRLLSNGRRQITGFAVSGDLVGLGAGTRHRCTAEASVAAKVRALPAIALHRMANEDSHLGMRLYDALSQELATTQDQLMTLGRLNAAERVATFLLSMSERNARALRPAHRIDLPMTRCDIADFLGLTTETISRTLTKLANGNIISRHSGHIRILSLEALEDVAAGHQRI